MFKFLNKKNNGFTLIELLVVIAIISILAGVITIGLSNARERARDAKRESDLTQISLAVERYYNDNYQYPLSLQVLADDNYLTSIPKDPFNIDYSSEIASDGQSYCIWAELERGGFLAVSQKGYGFNSSTPHINGCW